MRVKDVLWQPTKSQTGTDTMPPLPPHLNPETLHPSVRRLFDIEQPPQRSDAWLAMRRGLLTASDVAAALDIKPFASYKGSPRADLLKKKAQQAIGIETFKGNEYTRHGTLTHTSMQTRLRA